MRSLLLLAALGAIAAGSPVNKGGYQVTLPTVPPAGALPIVVPARPLQPVVLPANVDFGNVGTSASAAGSSSVRTSGNARSNLAGGTRAVQAAPSHRAESVVKLTLDSQENGAAASAGRADTRTDLATGGFSQAASSQTGADSNILTSGQALGTVDSNAVGGVVAEATKTHSNSGSSVGSVGDGEATGSSQGIGVAGFAATPTGERSEAGGSAISISESAGNAGTDVASVGEGAATANGDTTASGGAQTATTTTGDGSVISQQEGTSSSTSVGDETREVVNSDTSSRGTLVSAGPGAGAAGQSRGRGGAQRAGVQTSESQSSNSLNGAGDGDACAEVSSSGGAGLSLDAAGGVVTQSAAGSGGRQCSRGNANSQTSTDATGGVSTPLGGTLSDSTFGGNTAGDGEIEGSLVSNGETRIDLGLPRTLPGLGDPNKPSDILNRLGGAPRKPADYAKKG